MNNLTPRKFFLLLIPVYNLVISLWNLRDILIADSYATDPSSLVMMIVSLIALPVSIAPFFFLRSRTPYGSRLLELNILFLWFFFLLTSLLPQY